MVITDSALQDAIWNIRNLPQNDDDMNFYNDSQYEDMDINDPKFSEYLSRNIQILDLNFKTINDDTYKQLMLLIPKCNSLNRIHIRSLRTTIEIDNSLLNILLSNKSIKKITFNDRVIIDFDYLLNNLDMVSSDCNISIYSFQNLEQEKRLLRMPVEDQQKFTINKFLDETHEKIYVCNRRKKVNLDLYNNYRDCFNSLTDFSIVINNVSELNLEQLERLKKDQRINGIFITCGFQNYETTYSIQEYENILKEINNIISQIHMPSVNDPNREKIIFAQVYKILGKMIKYDHYAVTDEGRLDEELRLNCRNLKNGLLGKGNEGKICVCAGYANIIQNICSVLGIDCDYISSHSKEIEDFNHFTSDPKRRKYENGTNDPMGHAYNSVMLDGKLYFCDLTFDSAMIRYNGTTEHFLKSFDDFYATHKDVGFSTDNVEVVKLNGERLFHFHINKELYPTSLPLQEQLKLFSIEGIVEKDIKEMQSMGYLGGFVEQYLNFVKTCKGKVEYRDLLEILKSVKKVEDFVLSNEFKTRASRGTALALPITIKTEKGDATTYIPFFNARDNNMEQTIEDVERRVSRGR